jgi:hypothetical protein
MNVETGFVIDLSGVDNISIIGWFHNGGDNQKVRTACFFNTWDQSVHKGDPLQWLIEQCFQRDLQCQWTIRSVRSGKYLGFDGAPSNGVCLVAVDWPQPWVLSPDPVDITKFKCVYRKPPSQLLLTFI